jgi:hypothetical protein
MDAASPAQMVTAAMFSADFLAVDPREITRSIDEKGYYAFPGALTAEFLAQLQSQLGAHRPTLNHNDVAPVWLHEQYFFPHALACSKAYFDYVTAAPLRAVCAERFRAGFRLKCHRYYETGPGHSMEWHADNVTNEGVVTDSDGLIFILYVNDVADGEFQLVADSYRDRKSGEWTYNYTNEQIEREFGDKVTSFRMPAGSLIVYDTYGIHRAKPIVSRTFVRKSIFFQVDHSDDFAEKLLLNPAFFDRRDDALLDYLGFGKPQDFPANPRSTVKDVPVKHLLAWQRSLAGAFLFRMKYGLFQLLPHDTRMRWRYWKMDTARSLKEKHPGFFRVLKSTVGRFI